MHHGHVVFHGFKHRSEEIAAPELETAGVDGIMIGRGTLGAPWIFEQITRELQGEEFSITNKEKLKIILEHGKLVTVCQKRS